jgi:hypothetical protein
MRCCFSMAVYLPYPIPYLVLHYMDDAVLKILHSCVRASRHACYKRRAFRTGMASSSSF